MSANMTINSAKNNHSNSVQDNLMLVAIIIIGILLIFVVFIVLIAGASYLIKNRYDSKKENKLAKSIPNQYREQAPAPVETSNQISTVQQDIRHEQVFNTINNPTIIIHIAQNKVMTNMKNYCSCAKGDCTSGNCTCHKLNRNCTSACHGGNTDRCRNRECNSINYNNQLQIV